VEKPLSQRPAPDTAARERLVMAAIGLFTRKGYAATSVREIVEAARVTKPVLYYHFKSKEGIYLETLRETMEEFEALLETLAPSAEPADFQVQRFCGEVFELFLKRIDVVRLVHSIMYGPPQGAPPFDFHAAHDRMVESIRGLIRLGVARREFRDGNEEGMTLAVLGAFNVVYELRMIHPERGVGRDALDWALDVVFRGMKRAEIRQERR